MKQKQAKAANEAVGFIRGERMNKQSLSPRRMITAAIVLVLVGQACTLSLFENPINSWHIHTNPRH